MFDTMKKILSFLIKDHDRDYFKWANRMFLISIIVPFGVVCFYRMSFLFPCISGIMDIKGVNEVGDFLGGSITPFLTMAAFFLLLNADKTQKEMLKISKEETKASREELAKSSLALEEQKKLMKREQSMNEEKNTLEVFFTLFNNWRAIADKEIFNVCYVVSVDPQMMDNEPKEHYIFDGYQPLGKKINIAEYGKHLKVFLNDKYIIECANFVSQPSIKSYGRDEYGYIIDNLSINAFPIISNFNYIIQYVFKSSTSKINKEIMISTIKNSISWGECFVMNMIASDYILGEIREDQDWRKLLKDNLVKLELNLKNYDGTEKEFIENHAGAIR